jgi:tetratricopeptide (TPR) repeat protein
MKLKNNILILFFLLTSLVAKPQLQSTSGARNEAIRLIQEGDNFLRYANWDQALIIYTRAINTDINYANSYMKRATLNARLGKTSEALSDYNRAITLNPYSEYIYDKRAKIKMIAMDYKGAINDINKAISINPVNNELLDHRAEDFITIGQYEKAL